jgi:exopolysaccharide biosynthesis polyprenyl glycosylphosphotransferase
MIRRHAAGFRALLMAADASLAAILLVGLSAWRFGPDWAVLWVQVVPEPWAFLALYLVGWLIALTANGLYRPRARWSLRAEAMSVLKATAVMALATLSVLFLFKLPDVSRLFLLFLFPAQALLTIASRAALRWGLAAARGTGRNMHYVLVLGAGVRGVAFARKLEDHSELGLRVVGFLEDPSGQLQPQTRWPLLGSMNDLESVLHTKVVDEVAVCLPFSQWHNMDAIARVCEEEGKIVRIPMDVIDHALTAGRMEDLDGTPVFSLVSGPDRALALAVKRLVDLSAAAVIAILLSPLIVTIALAVARDDGGPVLFRQRRVGLHGRSFDMIKFRSMSPDAEARLQELASRNEVQGRAFKITDDPRITRIGWFLRRTSLDELPQLWNVIRGEMSLVGPRPPLPAEVSGYDLWHRRRLSMKPGITGLWQVRDRRQADFDRWVTMDLEYIDRWSLWLDFKILLRTIPAALQGR